MLLFFYATVAVSLIHHGKQPPAWHISPAEEEDDHQEAYPSLTSINRKVINAALIGGSKMLLAPRELKKFVATVLPAALSSVFRRPQMHGSLRLPGPAAGLSKHCPNAKHNASLVAPVLLNPTSGPGAESHGRSISAP
jgi:hypothetical protein